MNSSFAQDLTTTCKQELNFCEIVYQGVITNINDRVFGDLQLGHRTTSQINNDLMSSGPYGAFKQGNQAAYFLKNNHLDPSTRSEFSPLALEVLEYNKTGLHQYFGNMSEFASIPDFEPINATKCSSQNLDYYKKVYNSTMYSFNGYFTTHELLGQNQSLSRVNDELFYMAKYGAYDKVNEASHCLGINNVNSFSLVQPLPDTVKLLNYNTARLHQYLPDFASYSTIPEFPFAIPILLASFVSVILFHRIRFRK